MFRSNFVVAALVALFIAGCAQTPPQPVQTTLPDVSVQDAQPMVLQGYTWKVYKQNDVKILADDLSKHPNKDFVIFAMTPTGYKHLANNYTEIQRYISEQKAIIVYLKKTISDRSAPVSETK